MFRSKIQSKMITALSACLAAAAILSGCSGTPEDTKGSTDVQTTLAPTADTITVPSSEGNKDRTLTVTFGDKVSSGDGTVLLEVAKSEFKAGATVKVELPEGEHYLAISISKDYVDEAIVYLPSGVFSYTIPNLAWSYPSELKRVAKHTVSARIPSDDELTAVQNLARNPLDLISKDSKIKNYIYAAWSGDVYPHATTSSVCRLYDSEESKYQFEARNAIDGIKKNTSHGSYPYQSWGPDSNFSEKNGYIKIDFGHEVNVDSLNMYIRADFPHDTYFKKMKVEFSDGSSIEFDIEKTADEQSFEIGGVKTTYIKITKLEKDDHNGWAAITEIEVMGTHVKE